MTTTLLYFAYGSNLHPLRLGQRAPSSRTVAPGVLAAHALRFHKRGADGSGKCNAYCTDRSADRVYGALYALAAADAALLDEAEGCGYERARVAVTTQRGRVHAFTYVAKAHAIGTGLRPYTWYRELVVAGARYHALPAAYRARLEATAALADPDAERALQHAALLAATGAERAVSVAAQILLAQDG